MTSSRPEILLVDDVPQLLGSLERLLSSEFKVHCANSGPEALQVLANNSSVQVIISDYRMPEMSGIELLKLAAERFPAIARILLTGVPELDMACDAIQETRLHRFLCKPCGPKELLAAAYSGVEWNEAFVAKELKTELLVFSNRSLSAINRNLEERVVDQGHSINCLRQLGIALNKDLDLGGITQIVANATSEALEGRGVGVTIEGPDGTNALGCAGPEMSTRMLAEPVTTMDGTIGQIIVDVVNSAEREITTVQQNILAAIASSTAVAAHNEFRRQQRDEAQYATVFALARLSERRDSVTGKHLERVSEYCRLIAESLAAKGEFGNLITPQYIQDLVLSAPLHDIGKVGIPDSILLKQGRLTESEWEIMKTHAQVGADTIRSVLEQNKTQSYLYMGLDITASHHEHWDGRGYPLGLAGDEIPLAARIMALADVYDALTTQRPYKDAWTHGEAVALIEERRGNQFDPRVVDVFLSCNEEFSECMRVSRYDQLELPPTLGPVLKLG